MIPAGASNITGCEYPKVKFKLFPCFATLYPTPLICNSLLYADVTPTIILLIRVLVKPCKLLFAGSSFFLITLISFSAISRVIFLCVFLSKVPFGPVTVIFCPSNLTCTSAGTVIGLFPILDIFFHLPFLFLQFYYSILIFYYSIFDWLTIHKLILLHLFLTLLLLYLSLNL